MPMNDQCLSIIIGINNFSCLSIKSTYCYFINLHGLFQFPFLYDVSNKLIKESKKRSVNSDFLSRLFI